MPEDRAKGEWDKTKGAVKETVGKVTGDRSTEAEGKLDRVKGEVEKKIGGAKDTIRRANDRNR